MHGVFYLSECVHLFFPSLSDRFWLFVMKYAGVTYIKHSCELITDEMSVSVKAKPRFGIITRLVRTHTHTQCRRVGSLAHGDSKDALRVSAHS